MYEGLSRLGQEQTPEPEKDMEFLACHNIKKPFLLYVGNSYPHKNLEALVRAFQRVLDVKPDCQLVLVGQRNYFSERLEEETRGLGLRVPKEINFTGYIDDRDLAKLYRSASLYVFPSLSEGFGLPPLEAMSFGLPVASSNASCLPEILGSAA
ncbi:MAG: glycosyltransferase, partial [Calditrichae bacterium]|nr:glycosyltransferase [Calditrichia bacterium]NIV72906.1 glycosyltransferase [Calditrichia bacterium]NIW78831.1 glycosyltransferase [Calditrichia bacterium]